MRLYMAVFSGNQLVRVVQAVNESRETIQAHPNGLLIYAIVRAESLANAEQMGRDIAIRYRERKTF